MFNAGIPEVAGGSEWADRCEAEEDIVVQEDRSAQTTNTVCRLTVQGTIVVESIK